MQAVRYNKLSMRGKRLDQRGMASFLVTMIMMLVITLIVIGFSQVTRRNQREALDRQLSSQAFYAAESGINVASSQISKFVADPAHAGQPVQSSTGTGCATGTYYPSGSAGDGYGVATTGGLDNSSYPAATVKYTCMLITGSPGSLVFTASQDKPTVAPIIATNNLGSLSFSWPKQTGVTGTCAGESGATPSTEGLNFPPVSSWTCPFAVLRVELVPIAGGAFNDADARVFYMLPGTGGATSVAWPSAAQVGYADGNCKSTAANCTASVTGLSANNTNTYYALMSLIYRNAGDSNEITVTGKDTGGAASQFTSQAVIDVTGQAQDQLRRIQSRLNLVPTADSSGAPLPLYALTSSCSIDKQTNFNLIPGASITPPAACSLP